MLALAVFGVIRTPDSPGYVAYAEQILHSALPRGAALLASAPAPISLFRAPGYPLLLAALMATLPSGWALATVAMQIAATAGVAALAFRAALALGAERRGAMAAALLPAIGFAVVVEIAVLTDALDAACAAGACLILAIRPGLGAALVAGLLLAAATLLREAQPFLTLFVLPLAWLAGGRHRLWRAALVLALPAAAAAALVGWNTARSGQPVLTTSAETVMVQAVLPLLKAHRPVYDGADRFDAAARASLGAGEYSGIDRLQARLFAGGMQAPQIAREATARYLRAWWRFPLAMAGATLANFRPDVLAMPFQPVAIVDALLVYAGWRRPGFERDRGWTVAAVAVRLLDGATQLAGGAIGLAALLAPWALRRRRNRAAAALRGLWIACAGYFAVYLPVHIEPRYLVPVVPLACVLAACAWRPAC